MTPEQIEEMKRDREAGTSGPWTWKTECGEWPNHSLIGGDGDPIIEWDMDLGFRFNAPEDGRRIARVPEMEAHILAQQAEIERLRGQVQATESAYAVQFDYREAMSVRLAEVEAERDRLLRALEDVWKLAAMSGPGGRSDAEARGWIEVYARAALTDGEGDHD